jgi:hypothetical protein
LRRELGHRLREGLDLLGSGDIVTGGGVFIRQSGSKPPPADFSAVLVIRQG